MFFTLLGFYINIRRAFFFFFFSSVHSKFGFFTDLVLVLTICHLNIFNSLESSVVACRNIWMSWAGGQTFKRSPKLKFLSFFPKMTSGLYVKSINIIGNKDCIGHWNFALQYNRFQF